MFNFGTFSSFAPATPSNKDKSLQKLDLSSVKAYLAQFKPGYKAKMCQQKLDTVFQVNNEVRDWNGNVYKVFDVQLGAALLLDANDTVLMVTWISDTGHLKLEIADDWELVKAARATPSTATATWELLDAEPIPA